METFSPTPEFFVTLPFLPPSANNIFGSSRHSKKRFKTPEAERFTNQAVSLIAAECQSKIVQLNTKGVYQTYYRFFFPDDELLNMTYRSGKKNAAASRYKRMDVENRVKLVADALAKAIGIDDSQFFCGGHEKCSATLVGGTPQIHIFLSETEPGRFGL